VNRDEAMVLRWTAEQLGGGDAEGIRRPDGGGADRLSRAPECCVVRICPACTGCRAPSGHHTRGGVPALGRAHDTGDECRPGWHGEAGGFGHPPAGSAAGASRGLDELAVRPVSRGTGTGS